MGIRDHAATEVRCQGCQHDSGGWEARHKAQVIWRQFLFCTQGNPYLAPPRQQVKTGRGSHRLRAGNIRLYTVAPSKPFLSCRFPPRWNIERNVILFFNILEPSSLCHLADESGRRFVIEYNCSGAPMDKRLLNVAPCFRPPRSCSCNSPVLIF